MPPSHAAVVLRYIDDIWNAGNLTNVDRYVHASYSVEGEPVGVDWVRNNAQSFRKAFPDLHVHVEELIENETGVALLLRLRGTHLGEWKGWPPSGNTVDCREAAFWALSEGKLLSGRFVADTLGLRIQLGVIPATAWRGDNVPDQAR